MRRTLWILPFLVTLSCGSEEARTDTELRPFDFKYPTYAAILAEHVQGDRVDYAGLKRQRTSLDSLVEDLTTADLSEASEPQRLAFYINAYNIITLRSVVDAYPVSSIKDIDGVWDKKKWRVAGGKVTLNDIEHEILRKQFAEPRIHMAINCASLGCPPLLNQPFFPDSLEAQLELASRQFAGSGAHNVIDTVNAIARLSSIFDWFGDDFVSKYYDADSFPGLSRKKKAALNFVWQHLDQPPSQKYRQSEFDVSHLDYDWSLNDVE